MQDGDDVKFYRHYPDGWQQTLSGDGGGLFVVFPEGASEDLSGIMEGQQLGDMGRIELQVLFDATADPRKGSDGLDTDVVITLREQP